MSKQYLCLFQIVFYFLPLSHFNEITIFLKIWEKFDNQYTLFQNFMKIEKTVEDFWEGRGNEHKPATQKATVK